MNTEENISLKDAEKELVDLIKNDAELNKIASAVRITISAAPDNYMAFTVAKEPTNVEEWIALLENVVSFLKAPTVPDPEVLGKYSTPDESL
jgi:adenosine/AMP kinase